jgi:hypothetical protein
MVNSSKADERNTIKQILQNAAILQSSAERVLNAHPQRRGMVATTPQLDEATQAKIAALSAIKPRMPGNILQGNVELFTGNKVKVVDISLDTARASHYATMPGLCWLQFNNDDWTYKTGADGQTDEIAGFITCSENTVLKTQLGIIDCKAGARVFIVERKDSEAICTLDSGNLSDVKVKIGDQFARRIPPGREILLSKDFVNPIEDTALTHQIGVRALREVARLQGTRIAEQDFSVPSAILALPPLREKLESKNPADKKMVDSLLNNAVILTNLTSAAGAYQETK